MYLKEPVCEIGLTLSGNKNDWINQVSWQSSIYFFRHFFYRDFGHFQEE